jgi:UbiD family decarboxylase
LIIKEICYAIGQLGMYRNMVQDTDTGILQAYSQTPLDDVLPGLSAEGKRHGMAVVIGVDPSDHVRRQVTVPPGLSELDVAGGIRANQLIGHMRDRSRLEVPAARDVSEGEIRPGDLLK